MTAHSNLELWRNRSIIWDLLI